MDVNFAKVKNYLLDLEYTIEKEDEKTGMFTISIYKQLLQKNRDIIHGAFALNEKDEVIFRDTLQIENLDLNEIEGSINSLTILLSEYSDKIVEFSK